MATSRHPNLATVTPHELATREDFLMAMHTCRLTPDLQKHDQCVNVQPRIVHVVGLQTHNHAATPHSAIGIPIPSTHS